MAADASAGRKDKGARVREKCETGRAASYFLKNDMFKIGCLVQWLQCPYPLSEYLDWDPGLASASSFL